MATTDLPGSMRQIRYAGSGYKSMVFSGLILDGQLSSLGLSVLIVFILVAFMFCYWAWNRIMQMVPVTVSSLSSLSTPLIGVLGGVIFLGEPLGWREIVASLLIVGAVGSVSLKR